MQSDMLVSVAIVSVCINIFFFVGVGIYTTTNKLDESAYSVAYSNLCIENYKENAKRAVESNPENPDIALLYFEVACKEGEFSPYYEDAVEAYISDKL